MGTFDRFVQWFLDNGGHYLLHVLLRSSEPRFHEWLYDHPAARALLRATTGIVLLVIAGAIAIAIIAAVRKKLSRSPSAKSSSAAS